MNAAREGQGGLIAISVSECDAILAWYYSACDADAIGDIDIFLANRLRAWRSRHVPAGAVDDD